MTAKTNLSQMTTLSYDKSQLKKEFHREAFLMGREKKGFLPRIKCLWQLFIAKMPENAFQGERRSHVYYSENYCGKISKISPGAYIFKGPYFVLFCI